MSVSANRLAVLRFNEEVVSRGMFDVIYEVMDANVVHRSAFPGQAAGVEGVRASAELLRQMVPDLTLTPDDIVEEGEKVWVRFNITGTHRDENSDDSGGTPFTSQEYFAARCRDGKIVEFTSMQDRLSIAQQLDAISSDL